MVTTIEPPTTEEIPEPRYAPPPFTPRPTFSEHAARLVGEVRKSSARAAAATLALCLLVIGLASLRPVAVTGADDLGAFKAKCGLSIYVLGDNSSGVQRTCRDAYGGRAITFFIAAIGLVFASALLAVLLSRPAPAQEDERETRSLWRRLTRTPGRAALLTLNGVLLVVAVASLLPVRVHGDSAQGAFSAECGMSFYLSGHDDSAVEQACRDAYGGHAMTFFASAVVLVGAGVALGMSARGDRRHE
jgi:hypothetical protein